MGKFGWQHLAELCAWPRRWGLDKSGEVRWNWVEDRSVCVCLWKGLCAEVGIQQVCCWRKAGHGVNGIESQACVALDSLYVVVVNGDETLDGRWKCISERPIGVSVRALRLSRCWWRTNRWTWRSVRMLIRACGGWRVYTSAQNDWSAEMLVVADGGGCEVVGPEVG